MVMKLIRNRRLVLSFARTCLFVVMFFVFSGMYARADKRQNFEPLIMDEPFASINGKDSGWEPLEVHYLARKDMPKESTDDDEHITDNGANETNTHESRPRYVDFFNKWMSLSFDEENRGIYFMVTF